MIEVGDIYPLICRVTRENGDPVDAGDMSLVITLPDGTTRQAPGDLEIGHTIGSGTYTCDVPTTMAGQHQYKWTATGNNSGVQADVFNVEEYGPRLVSLDEAKEALRGLKKQCSRPADLERLRQYILVASRAVELDLKRVLTVRTIVEKHYPDGPIVLRHGPLREVVSIVTDGQAMTPGTWRPRGDGILDAGYVWSSTWGSREVTVTYRAGDQVVDLVARKVCLSLIRSMWRQQQQVPNLPPEDIAEELQASVTELSEPDRNAYAALRRMVVG